jgi:signal transduction histidine kinase
MQGAFRDRHGALWFTYSQAVLRLLPTPGRPVAPPRTFINAVSVAGRDYPVPATSTPTTHRIVVPSGATLRGEFGAPWFGAPGDLTYQYRLEGVDPDWIGAAQARSVSYAGIAPGSYTLGIRALATGLASPEVVTVPFTVVPPLWRRPAFLLPLAVAAALLAYAAYRLRLRRALELANMRTRIATDLHDDIGADLTRIGILTEVVRHHIGAGHAEDSRLASIARLARDSVGAMSDIVWAINPERDSLVDLARKIRDVAEDLAAGSGLDLDLVLPGVASNTRLDMDVRRDLLLICKETLNNAVRHARARRLCLSLREDGGRLSLDMTDDGVGFDADQDFEGNGLVSMRRRAERIGASLSVRSQPGRGTTVRVELPLRRRARSRRAPTPRGR